MIAGYTEATKQKGFTEKSKLGWMKMISEMGEAGERLVFEAFKLRPTRDGGKNI